MRDPSFRHCPSCAKRTVHRKVRRPNRDGGDYAWACAECNPKRPIEHTARST